MENNSDNNDKRSVSKSIVSGAVIGAALWPAIRIVFDAFSNHKSLTRGNRLRILSSEAFMGAAFNGALNGAITWFQNKASRHVDKVQEERQLLIENDRQI